MLLFVHTRQRRPQPTWVRHMVRLSPFLRRWIFYLRFARPSVDFGCTRASRAASLPAFVHVYVRTWLNDRKQSSSTDEAQTKCTQMKLTYNATDYNSTEQNFHKDLITELTGSSQSLTNTDPFKLAKAISDVITGKLNNVTTLSNILQQLSTMQDTSIYKIS